MEKEFDLSKKINKNAMGIINGDYVIMVKDVQEFIRLLKEKIDKSFDDDFLQEKDFIKKDIIDKLAGDKLK